MNKEGNQIRKLKSGNYLIEVKVFDNAGLENIEIIKLKVNGKIEIEDKNRLTPENNKKAQPITWCMCQSRGKKPKPAHTPVRYLNI